MAAALPVRELRELKMEAEAKGFRLGLAWERLGSVVDPDPESGDFRYGACIRHVRREQILTIVKELIEEKSA